MNILCLTKRWANHTQSGGYDRLAIELRARTVITHRDYGVAARLLRRAWLKLWRRQPYHIDYDFSDWLGERKVLFDTFLHQTDVIHALYADDQLDFLLKARRYRSVPLVGTFHYPLNVLDTRKFSTAQRDDLKKLDGAIVLAPNLVPAFEDLLGTGKVTVVPLGVDTKVFHPAPKAHERDLHLVFVGFYQRDFEVAHEVMDRCYYEKLNVHFSVVTDPARSHYFIGCKNTTVLDRLPENELIRLYQSADALFLPFREAVANQAILEALACGIPVISSDLGGVPYYVDENCGWLERPYDADALFERVRALEKNRDLVTAKRSAARERALRFSWEKTALQLKSAYESLIQRGTFGLTPHLAR